MKEEINMKGESEKQWEGEGEGKARECRESRGERMGSRGR